MPTVNRRIHRPYQPSLTWHGEGPTQFELQGTGRSANVYRPIWYGHGRYGYGYPHYGRDYSYYYTDNTPGYAGSYDRYLNPSYEGYGTAPVLGRQVPDKELDADKEADNAEVVRPRFLPPKAARIVASNGWAHLSATPYCAKILAKLVSVSRRLYIRYCLIF